MGEEKPRTRSFAQIGLLVVCVLALVAAPFALYLAMNSNEAGFFGQKIANPKSAYDFQLTAHTGAPLRLSALKDKVVLLSFGFTHCPDICPTTLYSLAKIYEALPEADRSKVQVVFITFDPQRDSVEKLAEYVPFYNPAFLGATGTEEEIKRTAREYGAFFEYAPLQTDDAANSYTVNHSSYLYLIDEAGNFSLLYSYEKLPQTEKIAADIIRILHGG